MFDFILLFFDISTGEIIIILIVVFLIFGPQKIPELARKIGKGVYEIKKASREIKDEINSEVNKVEKESGIKDIDDKLKEFKNTVK
ncbi:MAG: twin-arginine translocase TatA/TatE family subunit [Bacteroidetes bacterium]|nr:twin-arginine translocase TatA/TatE family subunit [Bacteroidota bacterium]MCK4287687.1 twin-arginine translocase TatA/TatE family subunit [Bacteroidales bacterium]MCK4360728.1 twin-arginine translocase TatA/TatE family subunit [Bacteroidales bacterium]MCK4406182.1 twin-arginine translocase TatA/TatE family subunit [Bacteroidales bacterium]